MNSQIRKAIPSTRDTAFIMQFLEPFGFHEHSSICKVATRDAVGGVSDSFYWRWTEKQRLRGEAEFKITRWMPDGTSYPLVECESN